MWLIGKLFYRGHHWMNTRGEVLFGLTVVLQLISDFFTSSPTGTESFSVIRLPNRDTN